MIAGLIKKCDITSLEVKALRGAPRLLTEEHPTILGEIRCEHDRIALVAKSARLGYACRNWSGRHLLVLPQ